MTNKPIPFSFALTLAAMLAMTLAGCGPKEGSASAAVAPASASEVKDPLVVVVRPDMASRFKVGPVAMADVASSQDVAGRVDANERFVTRIGAAVTGRVTEVLVEVGDRVAPGQPLARVSSPDLTTAQLAYLRASSAASLAERAVDRARQLIQADVIGSAELQRRESELAVTRAELRAAGDQLRLLGLSPDAISKLKDTGSLQPFTTVQATSRGVVVERKVSPGQVAQPGDQLFTVADLSTVWVVGELPEQAARHVAAGQQVTIDVPALDADLTGRIVHVGDTVSAVTRTVPIRTELQNKTGELKPQMLATMHIAGPTKKGLVVPALAVVREDDKDHVYVRQGENRYRLTQVELGPNQGDVRPVIKGLNEGQQVVVEGAFHLNNERNNSPAE